MSHSHSLSHTDHGVWNEKKDRKKDGQNETKASNSEQFSTHFELFRMLHKRKICELIIWWID